MKKYASFLSFLLLICVLLSSCTVTPDVSTPEQSDAVSAEESTVPEPIGPAGESDDGKNYTLSYVTDRDIITAVAAYDDDSFIVTFFDYESEKCGYSAYRISTGEKIAGCALASPYPLSEVRVYGDGAFDLSSAYGFCASFDAVGGEPKVLNLTTPDSDNSSGYEQFGFVRGVGYFRTDDEGVHFGTDSRETEKLILKEDGVTSGVRYSFERNGLYYFIGYSMPDYTEILLSYDIAKNEFDICGSTDARTYFRRDNLFIERVSRTDSLTVSFDGKPYSVVTVMLENPKEEVRDAGEGCFLTSLSEYGEDYSLIKETLYLYNLDGALVYSGSVAQDGMSLVFASLYSGKYILTFSNKYDEEGILEKTVVVLTLYSPEDRVERTAREYGVADESFSLAYNLTKRFGVNVRTGSAAIIDFPDFVAEPETDETTVKNALGTIDKTLGLFPDGFFEELMEPIDGVDYCQTNLCICLTGKLRPVNEYSTSFPIAYAYTEGSTYYIVLDIDYSSDESLTQTLSHELMHTIESRITNLVDRDFDGFGDWFDYVPDDSYNCSYVDKNGNDFSGTKYTTLDDKHTVYYIDSYSRTFPTEDRARLFENLFMSEDTLCSVIADYPKILARTEYMCSVIRQAFKTVAACDDVWWERYLENG